MAIQNRDLGTSEQRAVFNLVQNAAVVTGASVIGPPIPFACTLEGVYMGALGISGAPQYLINVLRSTSGGATTIALGVSNQILAVALGASGPVGWSGIAAAGSTLLSLQAGDVVLVTSSVANTAVEKLLVSLVVKKTADIVKHYTLST